MMSKLFSNFYNGEEKKSHSLPNLSQPREAGVGAEHRVDNVDVDNVEMELEKAMVESLPLPLMDDSESTKMDDMGDFVMAPPEVIITPVPTPRRSIRKSTQTSKTPISTPTPAPEPTPTLSPYPSPPIVAPLAVPEVDLYSEKCNEEIFDGLFTTTERKVFNNLTQEKLDNPLPNHKFPELKPYHPLKISLGMEPVVPEPEIVFVLSVTEGNEMVICHGLDHRCDEQFGYDHGLTGKEGERWRLNQRYGDMVQAKSGHLFCRLGWLNGEDNTFCVIGRATFTHIRFDGGLFVLPGVKRNIEIQSHVASSAGYNDIVPSVLKSFIAKGTPIPEFIKRDNPGEPQAVLEQRFWEEIAGHYNMMTRAIWCLLRERFPRGDYLEFSLRLRHDCQPKSQKFNFWVARDGGSFEENVAAESNRMAYFKEGERVFQCSSHARKIYNPEALVARRNNRLKITYPIYDHHIRRGVSNDCWYTTDFPEKKLKELRYSQNRDYLNHEYELKKQQKLADKLTCINQH